MRSAGSSCLSSLALKRGSQRLKHVQSLSLYDSVLLSHSKHVKKNICKRTALYSSTPDFKSNPNNIPTSKLPIFRQLTQPQINDLKSCFDKHGYVAIDNFVDISAVRLDELQKKYMYMNPFLFHSEHTIFQTDPPNNLNNLNNPNDPNCHDKAEKRKKREKRDDIHVFDRAMKTSVHVLAYDQLSQNSPNNLPNAPDNSQQSWLCELYEDKRFLALVSEIVGQPLFPSDDPLGKVY